jgi:hypothetical protein
MNTQDSPAELRRIQDQQNCLSAINAKTTQESEGEMSSVCRYVKAGVKVGQRGGAKVGQWMAMQLLSISWGRASGA